MDVGLRMKFRHAGFVRRAVTILVGVVALAVGGCDQGADAPATAAQAVATVNGAEITIHQLNNELANEEFAAPEGVEPTRDEVLQRLIDRKLLVQRARALELDRTPQVALDIARAREQILARVYMEQLMATVAEPTDQQIREYYDSRPLLYGQRKRYRFTQMVVDYGEAGDIADKLDKAVANARNMEAVTRWLDTRGVPFVVIHSNDPAENIPASVLNILAGLEPGQFGRIDGLDSLILLELHAVEDAALSRQAASATIRDLLLDQWRLEIASKELDALRERSEIRLLTEDGTPGDEQPAGAVKAKESGDVE